MGTLKKLLQNKIEYTGGRKQISGSKWRLKAAAFWSWGAQLVTQLFQMYRYSNVTCGVKFLVVFGDVSPFCPMPNKVFLRSALDIR